ncbi:MAG: 50S ribosomal protein L17 [Candidatus Magasanikbacteria bacterium]|nr:50S ribosomal protein L17 [Candidatus Magasanikbacteria bacterium]
MRHQKKKVTLDRKSAARRALLRNLAASLILYEKIRTTKAKAKAIQPLVEKMITLGKKGDLAARRRLISFFHTENPVKKIMEDLGKRYAGRSGGCTRLVKLGARRGDGAEVAQIELV